MTQKQTEKGVLMFRAYSLTGISTFLCAAFMASTLWVGQGLLNSERAEACRDCPFPMRIADGYWRMPNGITEIKVDEVNLGSGRVQTVVQLFDANSGVLLAMGSLDHNKGRKRLKVELVDFGGGRMTVDLHYANMSRTKIKVKMTCEQCNVQSSYWN